MRAVVLEMPDEWIEERRRLGHDGKDEMWEGVLHMVPPGSSWHALASSDLTAQLRALARPLGLECLTEPGIFDPAVAAMASYRVPDLAVAAREHLTDRGIEGRAALAVEILSPNDESYEKLDFYRRVGVGELLYVEPRTGAFEIRAPDDADGWTLVPAGADGRVPLRSLAGTAGTVDGAVRLDPA